MDIVDTPTLTGSNGAIWGTETDDLDATLVRWGAGGGVDAHVSDEVDVVMVVLAGAGMIIVDETSAALQVGSVIVVPKGSMRQIVAGDDGLTYLNVHKRKRRLMPNMKRPS